MIDTIISARGLEKKFYIGMENELHILHDISFEIKKGEFVSIVGSSGAGKSTLMNIIGLLDQPTEGQYMLGGVNTSQLGDKELSHVRNTKIGFIFQSFHLIPRMNALNNVELPMVYKGIPRKERIARAKELLDMVGMSDIVNITLHILLEKIE